MSVHDWTRADPGIYHHLHTTWITHLSDALNGGILPEGYYSMAEQHAGKLVSDVLTLQMDSPEPDESPRATAVALAPPRVSRKQVAAPNVTLRAARRTLTIRHVSSHRIVALIEILSPANKDRLASVQEFVGKAQDALRLGCHLLVVDLFPPGRHDPRGIHGAIWEWYDPVDYEMPDDKPLTLVAYMASELPEAYVEHIAVGDSLPDMPLFIAPGWYVQTPLEATYQAAYRGVPAFWRAVIEGSQQSPSEGV